MSPYALSFITLLFATFLWLSIPLYILSAVLLLAILCFAVVRLRNFFVNRKIARDRSQRKNNDLVLHMVSETEYVTQGQGVHTAFVEMVELLEQQPGLDLVINDRGWGDVYHSHTYGPYYFWKGFPYKGRRILTAHVIPDSSRGTIPFWKTLLPLTTLYLKMTYAFADVVIAISPMVETKVKELKTNTRVVKIYNPVLTDNWKRTDENRRKGRQLLKLTDEDRVILGVGQLQDRKGIEDFIDIAAAMPQYKFVWAGGRPWGRFTEGVSRIDKKIQAAPPNLTFAGLLDVKDMPPIYAAADVFLFPSYQENCPLAPLEAAAAGLPVVFRDLEEYKSLYSTAYLTAADNQEFITRTGMLLEDETYYQKAVKMSAQLLTDFDKDRIKDQLINLYKEVRQQAQR